MKNYVSKKINNTHFPILKKICAMSFKADGSWGYVPGHRYFMVRQEINWVSLNNAKI